MRLAHGGSTGDWVFPNHKPVTKLPSALHPCKHFLPNVTTLAAVDQRGKATSKRVMA